MRRVSWTIDSPSRYLAYNHSTRKSLWLGFSNKNILIARFMGPTMWPIWGRQGPGGPHVGPMNFAIWAPVAQYYTHTTNWVFEGERLSKLKKRALRIMTNSGCNAHTEPLFKELHLLKVQDIIDVQCLQFCYKFMNKKLPNYFRNMFKYNMSCMIWKLEITIGFTYFQPSRPTRACNVLRHHKPELLSKFSQYLINRIKTHSMCSVSRQIKYYLTDLHGYAYVLKATAMFLTTSENAYAETCILWLPCNHWLYIWLS